MKKNLFSVIVDQSGKTKILNYKPNIKKLLQKGTNLKVLQFVKEDDAMSFADKIDELYKNNNITDIQLAVERETHKQQIQSQIKCKQQASESGVSVSLQNIFYHTYPQDEGYPLIFKQKKSLIDRGYDLSKVRIYHISQTEQMINDLVDEYMKKQKDQKTHIDIMQLQNPVQEEQVTQINSRDLIQQNNPQKYCRQQKQQSQPDVFVELQQLDQNKIITKTFEQIQIEVLKIIEENPQEYRWFKILEMLEKNSLQSDLSYNLFFDGSTTLSQDWESACAFVLKNEKLKDIFKIGIYLGFLRSNGAEFTGLLFGLTASILMGAKKLQVFGDSQVLYLFELVINIMNQKYKVHDVTLSRIYKICVLLIEYFEQIKFIHIPREMNQDADYLARNKREKFIQMLKEKKKYNQV